MMSTATPELGTALLALARAAIARALHQPVPVASPTSEAVERMLDTPGATFVTLTQHGALRGCIGSLEAHRPLREDVQANAVAAALHDPRFAPLSAGELPHTRVEVSLLSPSEPLPVRSRTDALRALRPGVDGVIFEWGRHRSTFLPQVWAQLPEPERFLQHLVAKAGLPPTFWDDRVRLQRYTVRKWGEDGPVPHDPPGDAR